MQLLPGHQHAGDGFGIGDLTLHDQTHSIVQRHFHHIDELVIVQMVFMLAQPLWFL